MTEPFTCDVRILYVEIIDVLRLPAPSASLEAAGPGLIPTHIQDWSEICNFPVHRIFQEDQSLTADEEVAYYQ